VLNKIYNKHWSFNIKDGNTVETSSPLSGNPPLPPDGVKNAAINKLRI